MVKDKARKIEELMNLKNDNDRLIAANQSLQADLEQIKAELDEKTKPSSAFSPMERRTSLMGTPSRRLGAELARQLSTSSHESLPKTEEAQGEDDEAGPDDSIIETVTRHVMRRSKGKGKQVKTAEYVEVGVQAEPEPSAQVSVPPEEEKEATAAESTSADDTADPPTYDEAALERSIAERLHPATVTEVPEQIAQKWPEYAALSKLLHTRCDVFEARMLERERAPTQSPAAAADPATIQRKSQNHTTMIPISMHRTAFLLAALTFLLGSLFTRVALPAEHHYHVGPFSEKASAWHARHSFLLPAGSGLGLGAKEDTSWAASVQHGGRARRVPM